MSGIYQNCCNLQLMLINILTIFIINALTHPKYKYIFCLITMESTDQSLLTSYESYQEDYNNKCSEWRSEPVAERKFNDVGCVVGFFILLGAFLAAGIYYIGEKGNIDLKQEMHVISYSGQIMACIGISIVLSFAYIFLIKLMPKIMVYFLLVFTLALLLGLAILGFAVGDAAMGIPFLLIFVVYTIVLVCFRKKIQLGITLIKVASQFLSEKWGIFITPIIKIAFNILFTFFWIYSLNCILLVSIDKNDNKQDNTVETIVTVIWFFIWFFFAFIFYYVMVFTVAVACSFWYYRVEGKHYLPTAYKWLFTSAFGSIVFASFVIAIVTFARMILDTKRRSEKNIAVAVCLCIISCCLRRLQNLLRILNHNSVIVMAVTGEDYISSAKTTIGILSRFLPLMSVTDIISNLLIFWGVVIITGVTAIISYFWLDSKGLNSNDMALIMVICIFGSIFVSTILFSVLIEAISSVFIFYCFDVKFKQLGYSSHNMPAQINQALGNTNFEDKPY